MAVTLSSQKLMKYTSTSHFYSSKGQKAGKTWGKKPKAEKAGNPHNAHEYIQRGYKIVYAS